jgi:hypothetical protein
LAAVELGGFSFMLLGWGLAEAGEQTSAVQPAGRHRSRT